MHNTLKSLTILVVLACFIAMPTTASATMMANGVLNAKAQVSEVKGGEPSILEQIFEKGIAKVKGFVALLFGENKKVEVVKVEQAPKVIINLAAPKIDVVEADPLVMKDAADVIIENQNAPVVVEQKNMVEDAAVVNVDNVAKAEVNIEKDIPAVQQVAPNMIANKTVSGLVVVGEAQPINKQNMQKIDGDVDIVEEHVETIQKELQDLKKLQDLKVTYEEVTQGIKINEVAATAVPTVPTVNSTHINVAGGMTITQGSPTTTPVAPVVSGTTIQTGGQITVPTTATIENGTTVVTVPIDTTRISQGTRSNVIQQTTETHTTVDSRLVETTTEVKKDYAIYEELEAVRCNKSIVVQDVFVALCQGNILAGKDFIIETHIDEPAVALVASGKNALLATNIALYSIDVKDRSVPAVTILQLPTTSGFISVDSDGDSIAALVAVKDRTTNVSVKLMVIEKHKEVVVWSGAASSFDKLSSVHYGESSIFVSEGLVSLRAGGDWVLKEYTVGDSALNLVGETKIDTNVIGFAKIAASDRIFNMFLLKNGKLIDEDNKVIDTLEGARAISAWDKKLFVSTYDMIHVYNFDPLAAEHLNLLRSFGCRDESSREAGNEEVEDFGAVRLIPHDGRMVPAFLSDRPEGLCVKGEVDGDDTAGYKILQSNQGSGELIGGVEYQIHVVEEESGCTKVVLQIVPDADAVWMHENEIVGKGVKIAIDGLIPGTEHEFKAITNSGEVTFTFSPDENTCPIVTEEIKKEEVAPGQQAAQPDQTEGIAKAVLPPVYKGLFRGSGGCSLTSNVAVNLSSIIVMLLVLLPCAVLLPVRIRRK